jgi:hypothetical protein
MTRFCCASAFFFLDLRMPRWRFAARVPESWFDQNAIKSHSLNDSGYGNKWRNAFRT